MQAFWTIFRFEVMYEDSTPLGNLMYIFFYIYIWMTLEKIILVKVSWCFYNTITFQIFLKISGSFSNLLYCCAPHATKSVKCLV